MADYEESVSFLGHWGPFQRTVFLLLCLTTVPNGFSGLSIVFLGDTPPHRCLVPAEANLSAAWRNLSIPLLLQRGGGGGDPVVLVPSECSRYSLEAMKSFSDRGLVPGVDVNLSQVQTEGCLDGWEYDHSTYISTIVSEWDLVCDDKWKNPLTSSFFFLGILAGSLISGQLADRFGRKIVLFATLAVQTVFSFLQIFSPSWPVFCTMFFIVGMGNISNYMAAFVLGMETFIPPVRTVFSTIGICVFFGLGFMLLPLAAYFIRDWRMLLLFLTAPCVLFLPFWWFIPESPRWLLSQGRVEEAEAILRQAARKNKVEAPRVIFTASQVDLKSTKRPNQSICDLLRTRNIRGLSLTLWLVWTILNISYFALSLNTSNLHGSVFFNCFLSAAIEMPAYTTAWLMFRCLPRRFCLSSTFFLGGVVLLFIQYIPPDMTSVAIALEMVGKFGVTAAFSIVYAYSAELYPTVLRNTALGACSMAARVGSISAPYFIYLRSYSVMLPYILIGTITTLSGLISLLLPESYGMPLPDTISHMQRFPGCCRKKLCKLTKDTEERKLTPEVL